MIPRRLLSSLSHLKSERGLLLATFEFSLCTSNMDIQLSSASPSGRPSDYADHELGHVIDTAEYPQDSRGFRRFNCSMSKILRVQNQIITLFIIIIITFTTLVAMLKSVFTLELTSHEYGFPQLQIWWVNQTNISMISEFFDG